MHHRFHYTRTGEGFIAYDRHRPIQSAKRCATEGEAVAMVEKMKNDSEQRADHPRGPEVAAPYLHCGEHGREPWRGDVVCDACGRVYQTQDESRERFALSKCWCGVKLMPTPENKALQVIFGCDGIEGPLDFSARSICHGCFVRWDDAS